MSKRKIKYYWGLLSSLGIKVHWSNFRLEQQFLFCFSVNKFIKGINLNEITNKLLLAGDKFMPEMHFNLPQLHFLFCACMYVSVCVCLYFCVCVCVCVCWYRESIWSPPLRISRRTYLISIYQYNFIQILNNLLKIPWKRNNVDILCYRLTSLASL